MTRAEWLEFEEADKQARAWFNNLSPEKKRQRLIKIGILGEDGRLSPRYGGAPAKPSTERSAS